MIWGHLHSHEKLNHKFNTCTNCLNASRVFLFYIQGVSYWSEPYKLNLADRNIQARFCLKVVLEFWHYIFSGIITSFDKSKIGWPQQPSTKRVWDISEKLRTSESSRFLNSALSWCFEKNIFLVESWLEISYWNLAPFLSEAVEASWCKVFWKLVDETQMPPTYSLRH